MLVGEHELRPLAHLCTEALVGLEPANRFVDEVFVVIERLAFERFFVCTEEMCDLDMLLEPLATHAILTLLLPSIAAALVDTLWVDEQSFMVAREVGEILLGSEVFLLQFTHEAEQVLG